MLHLGQFHCFGIGTAKDMKLGQSWLKRGADLGNRDCAIFLGQSIGKTDGAAARIIFEQAISEGHLFAHTELAELDPTRARYHWEQSLLSEHPYSYTKYGEYLINQSATDEEKFTYVDWIRKGADCGDIYAHILLSTWYTFGANGCTKDEEVAKYWAQKGAAMGSPACYWTLGRMDFYD
jgi:TPR repeat protein